MPDERTFKAICEAVKTKSYARADAVLDACVRYWPQLIPAAAAMAATATATTSAALRTAAAEATVVIDVDAMRGGLLGQCVGDALGFLVEGMGCDDATAYAAAFRSDHATCVPTETRCGFAFGQYSDDSQLTREALIAFVQSGTGVLDPHVYGLRMALLFQPGAFRIVGYGYTTATACIAVRSGVSVFASGSKTSSGNGSAMRSAAIGWLHAWPDIAAAARIHGSITHASPRCIDGAAVVAFAARYAAATRALPFDAAHFFGTIIRALGGSGAAKTDFPWHLERLMQHVSGGSGSGSGDCDDNKKTPSVVVATWAIATGLADGEADWNGTIGCGVLQSVLWALYCFARYPDDFVDCVALAIAPGGDVDTTAAMAGAMCGSRVGVAGIPQRWVRAVNDAGEWNAEKLVQLASDAHALALAHARGMSQSN